MCHSPSIEPSASERQLKELSPGQRIGFGVSSGATLLTGSPPVVKKIVRKLERKRTSVTINPVKIDLRKVTPLPAQPRVPPRVTDEALSDIYSKLGGSFVL